MTYYILSKDGLQIYDYTSNKDKAENYDLDGYEVFTDLKTICDIIDSNSNRAYCKAWEEVSEDTYYDMLGALPPYRQDSNGFSMSEFDTGSITAYFLEHDGKYYSAKRDVRLYTLQQAYEDLVFQLSHSRGER